MLRNEVLLRSQPSLSLGIAEPKSSTSTNADNLEAMLILLQA